MNLSFFYPIPNSQELNSRMRSFGWINFEIDDHTFKLVKLISIKPEQRHSPQTSGI